MAICKMLDVSTAHISESDAKRLGKDKFPFRVQSHEYGFTIFMYCDGFEELADQIRPSMYSRGLEMLVRYAHAHDCFLVNLDRDGEALDFLPTYEW